MRPRLIPSDVLALSSLLSGWGFDLTRFETNFNERTGEIIAREWGKEREREREVVEKI